MRCSHAIFFSSVWKQRSFLYTVPSDKMAKLFSPTSTQKNEPVFGSS
ncbi:hypothetical protein [Exiguobacterium sp. PHA03]